MLCQSFLQWHSTRVKLSFVWPWCKSEKNGHNMTNIQRVGEREKDGNITHQNYIKIRNWKKNRNP